MDWNVFKDGDRDAEGETPGRDEGLLISTTKTQLQSDTENHGTLSTVPSRHRDSSGTVSFPIRS